MKRRQLRQWSDGQPALSQPTEPARSEPSEPKGPRPSKQESDKPPKPAPPSPARRAAGASTCLAAQPGEAHNTRTTESRPSLQAPHQRPPHPPEEEKPEQGSSGRRRSGGATPARSRSAKRRISRAGKHDASSTKARRSMQRQRLSSREPGTALATAPAVSRRPATNASGTGAAQTTS